MSARSNRAWRMGGVCAGLSTLALAIAVVGCCKVPESVKLYAADLPARADGQYALIDDDSIKKSLVVKDAMLQCKIDVEGGSDETSPACKCAKSSSPDWTVDCKAWLGDHTPKREQAAPAPATTAPPAAPATPS